MKIESIYKKSFVYFLGNLSTKLITLILIPLYAFYVTVEEMGQFDYAQTMVNLALPFVYIAVWEAILKFVLPEKDQKRIEEYVSSSMIILSFSVLIMIIFLVFFMINKESNAYVISMIITTGIAQIWQYYARANGSNLLYVYSGIISSAVNIFLTWVLLIYLQLGINALFLSFILSQISIFFVIEFRLQVLKRFKIKRVKKSVIVEMIKYSTPLVINLSATWFYMGFGKYIIVQYLGNEANGAYAFAARLSMIVSMVGSVINMAVIENAIYSIDDREFSRKFSVMINNLFRIFFSAITLLLPLLLLFYWFIQQTDFYHSYKYIPWLLLYSVLITMSTNIAAAFQAVGKTKYIFTTTVTGAIVTVVLSYLLITSIGIYSVLIGQCVGVLVMMLSRYYLLNKFIILKIEWHTITKLLLLFVMLSYVCMNFKHVSIIIATTLTAILIILINRNLFRESLIKIKNIINKFRLQAGENDGPK